GVVSVPGTGGGSFVLADLPGLIAGASRGHGLGLEFLRHVERTRLLIHVLDGAGGVEGRDPIEDFQTVNAELVAYSPALAGKPQLVAVNKMDLPEAQANWPRVSRAFERLGYAVYPIAAATGHGVGELIRATWERLQQIPRPERLAPPVRTYRLYTLDRSQDRWEAVRLAPHRFALRGP
ncbi:MAG: 50S ribosome-binding GTPase, partial [Anaerolineae bacterium]|nr:50S ribosome-binding GTPase [Anaerolineae bacterium]